MQNATIPNLREGVGETFGLHCKQLNNKAKFNTKQNWKFNTCTYLSSAHADIRTCIYWTVTLNDYKKFVLHRNIFKVFIFKIFLAQKTPYLLKMGYPGQCGLTYSYPGTFPAFYRDMPRLYARKLLEFTTSNGWYFSVIRDPPRIRRLIPFMFSYSRSPSNVRPEKKKGSFPYGGIPKNVFVLLVINSHIVTDIFVLFFPQKKKIDGVLFYIFGGNETRNSIMKQIETD